MKKQIFICGTGRTGTHLLGRTIASHPEVTPRIEIANTFNLITKIATSRDFTFPLINQYRFWLLNRRFSKIISKEKQHILEKSHPSLWLFEELSSSFKNAYFVGIQRDILPSLNSMLQHQGVLSWYSRLPQNKQNRFLGISENNKWKFNELSIEEKCALRWCSDVDEMHRLKEQFPHQFQLIRYKDLVSSPVLAINKIAEFLDLNQQFTIEQLHVKNIDKWKNELNENQIERIQSTLNLYEFKFCSVRDLI